MEFCQHYFRVSFQTCKVVAYHAIALVQRQLGILAMVVNFFVGCAMSGKSKAPRIHLKYSSDKTGLLQTWCRNLKNRLPLLVSFFLFFWYNRWLETLIALRGNVFPDQRVRESFTTRIQLGPFPGWMDSFTFQAMCAPTHIPQKTCWWPPDYNLSERVFLNKMDVNWAIKLAWSELIKGEVLLTRMAAQSE